MLYGSHQRRQKLLQLTFRQIDPSLVLPDWAPPIALPADLSFHAVPSISLVVDLLFFSPPYTIAFLPAFGLSGVIAFGYWFWIERCYRFNNFYPYPIFEILTTTQRIGFVHTISEYGQLLTQTQAVRLLSSADDYRYRVPCLAVWLYQRERAGEHEQWRSA